MRESFKREMEAGAVEVLNLKRNVHVRAQDFSSVTSSPVFRGSAGIWAVESAQHAVQNLDVQWNRQFSRKHSLESVLHVP